jgi:hypothetical protein
LSARRDKDRRSILFPHDHLEVLQQAVELEEIKKPANSDPVTQSNEIIRKLVAGYVHFYHKDSTSSVLGRMLVRPTAGRTQDEAARLATWHFIDHLPSHLVWLHDVEFEAMVDFSHALQNAAQSYQRGEREPWNLALRSKFDAKRLDFNTLVRDQTHGRGSERLYWSTIERCQAAVYGFFTGARSALASEEYLRQPPGNEDPGEKLLEGRSPPGEPLNGVPLGSPRPGHLGG